MDNQLLEVQARLVQDHKHVSQISWQAGCSRPTAALIYVACGCRIKKSRRVLNQARAALRGGGVPANPNAKRRYEASLLANVVVYAKRTTPGRERKIGGRNVEP